MVLSLTALLVLAAFGIAIVSGIGRAPLWPAVLLLALAALLAMGARL